MRIAICDDENEERQILIQYITAFNSSLAVDSFDSSLDLLLSAKHTSYNIVFMDIEMPEPNGFDTAVTLRSFKNPPLVIFVTKSNSYTIQGYGVAFRYLQKPIQYNTFASVLALALQEVSPAKISIQCNGMQNILSVRDIIYSDVLDHSVTIHTKSKEYKTRMSLAELVNALSSSAFASPHKSYLVNMNYVQSVGSNSITLKYIDESIPLSKGKRKQFILELGDFIGQ